MGGKLLAYYKTDEEPKWWTDKESINYGGDDNFSNIIKNSLSPSDVLIVMDDEYVEFRKALAEGKTIQLNEAEKFSDQNRGWVDLSCTSLGSSTNLFPVEYYRIKPEEPKFKVGDWVIHKSKGVCKIEKIPPSNKPDDKNVWLGNKGACFINELELWQPKPGEWCWVFNKLREVPVLRRVIKVEGNFKNRFNDEKFTKTVRVSRGDYLGDEVGYRFCEPFMGQLPTNLKDSK